MQRSSLLCCLWVSTFLWTGSVLGLTHEAPPSQLPGSSSHAPSTEAPDFSQARKLMQQGKLDEAIAELQALEASDPNSKGLDLEIGTAYYKKSDYVKAITFLKKA